MACDMAGYATSNEKWDLYWKLKGMSEEERKAIPFALFVGELGMLNGEQTFQYLQKNFIDKLDGDTQLVKRYSSFEI